MKLSNGVSGLGVGGGRDGAGVDDDDAGCGSRWGGDATTVEQLALDGGAVGLCGAATELLDEESRHLGLAHWTKKLFTQRPRSTQSSQRRKDSMLHSTQIQTRATRAAAGALTRITGFEECGKIDSSQGRDRD